MFLNLEYLAAWFVLHMEKHRDRSSDSCMQLFFSNRVGGTITNTSCMCVCSIPSWFGLTSDESVEQNRNQRNPCLPLWKVTELLNKNTCSDTFLQLPPDIMLVLKAYSTWLLGLIRLATVWFTGPLWFMAHARSLLANIQCFLSQ